MKLRLRGSSIRLRLTQSEVTRLAASGVVEESVGFAPGSRLVYRLSCGDSFGADLAGGVITVRVPAAAAQAWAASDQVGLETEQSIGGGETLRILVEKDWQCARPRTGEDESDAYPHPTGSC